MAQRFGNLNPPQIVQITPKARFFRFQAGSPQRGRIRALRDGISKVDAAARRAGFESAASLYRVLDAVVGLTPTDIRRLDDGAVMRLWSGPLETDPARLYRPAQNPVPEE